MELSKEQAEFLLKNCKAIKDLNILTKRCWEDDTCAVYAASGMANSAGNAHVCVATAQIFRHPAPWKASRDPPRKLA